MSQLTRLIGHAAQQRTLARFFTHSLTAKSNTRCLFYGSNWSGRIRDLAPPQWTSTRCLPRPWQFSKNRSVSHKPTPEPSTVATNNSVIKDSSATATSNDLFGNAANMGMFARFKLMYNQYWYVLIPVHVVTSICWFGGFYYLSKSGVDVPLLLKSLHLSDTIIGKVESSRLEHFAIAMLCYKVATPLRYALTLGVTTVSIKYLVKCGRIKPIPRKSRLIKICKDKMSTRARDKADKGKKDGCK